MLCPWCMHCGADDDEYVFDEELYCGICAQQMPYGAEEWLRAFQSMDPTWDRFVEQELNRIGAGRSGLRPEQRHALAHAIDAWATLRLSGAVRRGPLSDDEYADWLRYACTYFAPAGR